MYACEDRRDVQCVGDMGCMEGRTVVEMFMQNRGVNWGVRTLITPVSVLTIARWRKGQSSSSVLFTLLYITTPSSTSISSNSNPVIRRINEHPLRFQRKVEEEWKRAHGTPDSTFADP